MSLHAEQHRQLVKIYGLEYLENKSPLEQWQIYIADCNDSGFTWIEKDFNGQDVIKTDYPYLRKV